MNKFVGLFIIACTLFSCNIRNTKIQPDVMAGNPTAHFKDSTTVQMIDSVYNFGKVTDGEKVNTIIDLKYG